jgi:hypothetical protein
MISEKRAFEIQQVDYKDRFTVFNSIEQNNIISESVSDNIHNFLTDFIDKKLFTEKMGMICTSNLTENELGVILDQIPLTYKKYYETLGPVRLKALGYNITLVDREYKATLFDKENLKQEVYKIYQEGSRYSRNSLKENLQKLYDSLNYNKKAKANDIEEYFEVKDCKVLNSETGKYEHGFELIKKKE